MFDHIRAQAIDLHSLLIVRDNFLVIEAYFDPYGSEDKHELHSATKSITSALIGIAIEEGVIQTVSQKVLALFPDRSIQNIDSRKQAMTIEHLLTMTSGFEWPEFHGSQSEMKRLTQAWYAQEDRVQFVLDCPMSASPGEAFNYNTGCSHLLSAVIQKATGKDLFSYAREKLFAPLKITDVIWRSDPSGITLGGTALSMRPRDMAKLGLLYLNGGTWRGQQILPREWVNVSTHVHIAVSELSSYGYHWWVYPSLEAYAAVGYGGQCIFVLPSCDMVVVFTSGPNPQRTTAPHQLLEFFILPAVTAGAGS